MGSKAQRERKKKEKANKRHMKEWGKLNANRPTDKALKKARKLMVQKTIEQMTQAPPPKPEPSLVTDGEHRELTSILGPHSAKG